MLKHGKFFAAFAAAALIASAMLFNGCKGKEVVIIGSAGTPTAQVVAEMYAIALEAAGYRVERRFEIATSSHGNVHALHHALRDGHIDLYTGYTADETFMFDKEPATDPYSIYDDLKELFEKEGLTLLEPIPANGAYTLALLSAKASGENISTYSDLFAKAAGFKVAVTEQFLNGKEGFGVLEKTYQEDYKPFGEVITLNERNLYSSLDGGQVDVAVVRRYDGNLSDTKYKALRDNFAAFAPQIITPVTRQNFVEKHPNVRDVLNRVSVTLNDDVIIDLNHKLINLNQDRKRVARAYLRDAGLLR